MIKTNQQYDLTKYQIGLFSKAIEKLYNKIKLEQASLDGMKGQLEILKLEADEWERNNPTE